MPGASSGSRRGPDSSLRLVLPADDTAAGIARRYLAEHAAGISDEIADTAVLLVSELVTNAVRHGEPDIVLTLRLRPTGISVGVRDRGRALPSGLGEPPPPSAAQGRGLRFVDALSTDWGVQTCDPPPGKTVWFEIADPSGSDAHG